MGGGTDLALTAGPRLFLYGTLLWPDLLTRVAGRAVAVAPASLRGWHVERAAAGDWPVLLPGGVCEGVLTEPLDGAALARLDWYETVFGLARLPVETSGGVADTYRDGAEGSGAPWSLDEWRGAVGQGTHAAAAEIMRAIGAPLDGLRRRLGVVRARGWDEQLAAARPRASAGAALTAEDVAVHEVRHPFDGFHRVEVWTLDHATHAGGRSGRVERAISAVTDAAAVLPWDRARNRVLVVEQLRVGALAKGDPDPWLIEPIAGLIDFGEAPEATAVREAREEAGVDLSEDGLRLVSRNYPSPGGLAQVIWSFVAPCDLPDEVAGTGGLEHESEDIRVRLLGVDEALAMIPTGAVGNAPLVLSLQWIALERAGLNPR
ncbi:NUDIX domain-containing protein [Jannaschia sp. Os4]|uniref:NUDIX domain-containing protein n=1 Tax=Jannaschia sp. Os4 TaxID=2807617 RepID=UPI001939CE21|nr:NUDIX domain-containing protein [Jannaschia sp. Os4]MBM2577976.1 NUDIX domain-containing protein [Jannaschia sp. Os4]